jgi:Heparinase II/III-like protein/Heparinase II/III N-terminus
MKGLALLWLSTLISGLALSSALSDDRTDLCRWLSPPATGEPCDGSAWRALVQERAAAAPLTLDHLIIRDYGDPVAIAAAQWADGFQPRADLTPWPLRLPLDWGSDPFDDRNWQFHLNAWRMLDPLLRAYEATGERSYVADALGFVEDWFVFNVQEQQANEYGWDDMAAGIRAAKIAWLLDQALRGPIELSARQKVILVQLADLHASKLLEPDFLARGNHAYFQLHGLMAICHVVPRLGACAGAIDYASDRMDRLIRAQFSDEGVHLEDSPDYHFFVAGLLERLGASGWYDAPEIEAMRDHIDAVKPWLLHPDGHVVTIGDSANRIRKVAPPQGQASCRESAGYRPECFTSRLFANGYGVVRSDWAVDPSAASMLFVAASAHTNGHKHADDLTFEWYELGTRILVDTGRYGYHKDDIREFVQSTRAHNTVEIDGADFATRDADRYGSGLESIEQTDFGFVLRGRVRHATLGVEHERTLYYRPQEWLLVEDRLSAEEPHEFTQWFHFHEDIEVEEAEDGQYRARLPDGQLLWLRQGPARCPSDLIKGASTPRMNGWRSVSYEEMVPRYALGFTCAGKDVVIETVLSIGRPADQVVLPDRVDERRDGGPRDG